MVLGSQKEKWLHSPEHFINGKVTYHVKFVGLMEVDDPRDMDGMQSALQKLKFSQHIKRSEGQKAPKVDFSISVHGLTIVEPRTKEILHEIPLNHVSFCADDIQDKRLFSFIAKRNDKFYCYGLDSAHQANQITLTIGQAFDLALHRMNKTETNLSSLQVMELKKRIDLLQEENSTLKERIRKLQTPTQNTKASVPDGSITTTNSLHKQSSSYPSSSESMPSATMGNIPSTSRVSPDLYLFDEASVSHSSSNKKYLETKMNPYPDASTFPRMIPKQTSISQTIASVERAKASLKNLKDFVTQNKSRRKEKCNSDEWIDSCKAPDTHYSFTFESGDQEEPNSKRSPISGGASSVNESNNPPQATSILQDVQLRNKTKAHDQSSTNRSSGNSLFTGIDEVMSTIQQMMRDDSKKSMSNQLQMFSANTAKKMREKAENATERSITDLPETIIDDAVNYQHTDFENYANVSSLSRDQKSAGKTGNPPPLPPKPKYLSQVSNMDTSVKAESLCSASSGDVSSFETLSGNSFRLSTPDSRHGNINRNLKQSENTPDFDSKVDHISLILQKYSGEDGYMELKEVNNIAQNVEEPSVETIYDSVHKLMSAIRAGSCRNPNENQVKAQTSINERKLEKQETKKQTLKAGKSSIMTNPQHALKLIKQGDPNFDTPATTSYPVNHNFPLLSDPNTGKVGYMPIISRGISLATQEAPIYTDTVGRSQHSASLEQSSSTFYQAKSASSQSTRDVFDMQPFIEPMVQLSSPKEVYPGGPLSQTRHSTHMQANRFGRQRFEYELESTNELKGQGANAQHPVAENTFVLQKLLQSPNLSALLALVEQIQPDTYTSHSSTQQQHSLTETTSSDAATAQLINISNQEEEPTTNHVQQHEETSHQTNDSYTRKFKILEEGFSKGLAMEEAEIWLDDFDPLKNNNNK